MSFRIPTAAHSPVASDPPPDAAFGPGYDAAPVTVARSVPGIGDILLPRSVSSDRRCLARGCRTAIGEA